MLSPVKHIARANTEKKHDCTLDRKNMTSLTTSASLIFVCTYEFYAHKYNFRLPFTQSPILSRFNATILTKTGYVNENVQAHLNSAKDHY